MARVAALHAEGYQGTAIASLLNAEGWRPPKRCETFNGAMVQSLLARLGLHNQRRTPASEVARETDEWTLAELSHRLDIPQPTLYCWLRSGVFTARQVTQQSHPLWLIRADATELESLRSRRAATGNGLWPAATD